MTTFSLAAKKLHTQPKRPHCGASRLAALERPGAPFTPARIESPAGTMLEKARILRCGFSWGRVDSNHRRHCQQIYSLSPLATREHPHMHLNKNGAGGRIRTPDLLITNQLLYRLSYTSRKSSEGYNSKSERICQHENKSFPAAEKFSAAGSVFTLRCALPRSPQRALRALPRR